MSDISCILYLSDLDLCLPYTLALELFERCVIKAGGQRWLTALYASGSVTDDDDGVGNQQWAVLNEETFNFITPSDLWDLVTSYIYMIYFKFP